MPDAESSTAGRAAGVVFHRTGKRRLARDRHVDTGGTVIENFPLPMALPPVTMASHETWDYYVVTRGRKKFHTCSCRGADAGRYSMCVVREWPVPSVPIFSEARPLRHSTWLAIILEREPEV